MKMARSPEQSRAQASMDTVSFYATYFGDKTTCGMKICAIYMKRDFRFGRCQSVAFSPNLAPKSWHRHHCKSGQCMNLSCFSVLQNGKFGMMCIPLSCLLNCEHTKIQYTRQCSSYTFARSSFLFCFDWHKKCQAGI